MKSWLALWGVGVLGCCLWADGPGDNQPELVRPIPPPGIKISAADRQELGTACAELGRQIEALRQQYQGQSPYLELLPDVEIFHKAVDWALKYDEFYQPGDVAVARRLLAAGQSRARELAAGQPSWPGSTGLVVRGYVSRIDGSVQPYGLVVPSAWTPRSTMAHRLDIWCHGRDEKLTELRFLDQRQRQPGEFVPKHAFVLHLYGRYCNANKLAGEVDCFEALEHVQRHYSIDADRLVMRGFSMGGAAAWHFAVHYPDRFCAAAPGAGFSETPEFLALFQGEQVQPPWWERKLWHWYNATDYAGNLRHCPTVAYSGAEDKQKQAADVMARELLKEGLTLRHVIGPRTGHQYHPAAKAEIDRRIDALARAGRESFPHEVNFTTFTLRYAQCHWVRLDGLEKHWERARIKAQIQVDDRLAEVTTTNVAAFTLDTPPYLVVSANDPEQPATVLIDGQELIAPPVQTDRSWTAHFRKVAGQWKLVTAPEDGQLRKRPGLQGPLDDAFLDSFLVVRPTGQSPHARVDAWVAVELPRFLKAWRQQFRGEARIKDDTAVTPEDVARHHLILWGVPASNAMIRKVASKLPIRWADGQVNVGDQRFHADGHALALIYPNPLNPSKYVVLNSGFTFREYDYLNNARQVPKLPDWAVIDLDTPPNSRYPGRIAAAGFFGEDWQLLPPP